MGDDCDGGEHSENPCGQGHVSGVGGAEGYSIVRKFVIPSGLKPRFLANLQMMNITASVLFPGIDGLGRSIKEMLGLEAARCVNAM